MTADVEQMLSISSALSATRMAVHRVQARDEDDPIKALILGAFDCVLVAYVAIRVNEGGMPRHAGDGRCRRGQRPRRYRRKQEQSGPFRKIANWSEKLRYVPAPRPVETTMRQGIQEPEGACGSPTDGEEYAIGCEGGSGERRNRSTYRGAYAVSSLRSI